MKGKKINVALSVPELVLLRIGLRQAMASQWENQEEAKKFEGITPDLDKKLRTAQKELMEDEKIAKNHNA